MVSKNKPAQTKVAQYEMMSLVAEVARDRGAVEYAELITRQYFQDPIVAGRSIRVLAELVGGQKFLSTDSHYDRSCLMAAVRIVARCMKDLKPESALSVAMVASVVTTRWDNPTEEDWEVLRKLSV